MQPNVERYLDFASNISFFEFLQEEYKPSSFDIDHVKDELRLLGSKTDWTDVELAALMRQRPKTLSILEGIFQLDRFTNAQLIYFAFDVSILNSSDTRKVYDYAMFNLRNDKAFAEVFNNSSTTLVTDDRIPVNHQKEISMVAQFKIAISNYINQLLKHPEILEERIKDPEFSDVSSRIAHYVIYNLKLNQTLSTVDLTGFLRNKRVPRDTKSLHGNYPKIKLKNSLVDHGFDSIDQDIRQRQLNKNLIPYMSSKKLPKRAFLTERKIEGILRPKTNSLKKFDLLIALNGRVSHLFEINFYTTAGTKIGINKSEYIDLHNSLKHEQDVKFYWITDGNYWLTEDGQKTYFDLIQEFGEIYNINTFPRLLSGL
ncbi:MAG: hypothetical protein KIY11_09525 [Thermoplasmata archaeon]|nr:hypothetical protein [Candidatus Sysuiplasma acidicola]